MMRRALTLTTPGTYSLDLELYYCDNNDDGDCADSIARINPESDEFKKIIFGSGDDGEQKKHLTYTIDSSDKQTGGVSPRIHFVSPLDNIMVNKKEGRNVYLSIFDDENKIAKESFEYKLGEDGKWISKSDLLSEATKLDYGLDDKHKLKLYQFKLEDGLKEIGDGYTAKLSVRVKDDSGHQSSRESIKIYVDNTLGEKKYPECYNTNLKGN